MLFMQERDAELLKEAQRQEKNDELRRTFAQHANTFHAWLTETRAMLVDGSGTLESQLEAVKVTTATIQIVQLAKCLSYRLRKMILLSARIHYERLKSLVHKWKKH